MFLESQNNYLTKIKLLYYNNNMEVKYHGHRLTTQQAISRWVAMLNDYHSGMSVRQIRDKYVNPFTGRKYTAGHIYYAFRRLRDIDDIKNLKNENENETSRKSKG